MSDDVSPGFPLPLEQARQVDQICNRFEADWKKGERPRIEDFMREVEDADREVVLRELVLLDIACRRRGENPEPHEYLGRFPSLDPAWLRKSMDTPTISGSEAQSHSSSDDDTFSNRRPQTDLTSFLGPAQQADELGRLGGFRILKVLGQGGMGAVYLAQDARLGRKVALKVMLPELASTENARQRFLREAQAAASLEHDNIVPILHVAEDNGVPYIVMPYLKGMPLSDHLVKGQPLPIAEVLKIGRETAEALAAAHARGLIHRDIKPGNIWLESRVQESGVRPPETTQGDLAAGFRVKLLDFGLAHLAVVDGHEHLTRTGALLGTPGWMSPEQVDGGDLDGRSDLFSLGCVLYRLTTGRSAFAGTTLSDKIVALATGTPAPPHQLNPSLPIAMSQLIQELLAKKRDDRTANAAAVANRLAAIERAPMPPTLEEPTVKIASTVPAAPRRNRLMLVMIVAAIAIGITITLLPQIIVRLTDEKGNVRDIEVKPGEKIEIIQKPGEKKPDEPKKLDVVWKPVPFGQSPFDRLDAKEIPKAERFGWQPKELVAVIGSHARRHWGHVTAVTMSPDGKLAASHANSRTDNLIIWDMETQTPKWTFNTWAFAYSGSLQFSRDSKKLYCLFGGDLKVFNLFGKEPTIAQFELSEKEGARNAYWHFCGLCENDRTLMVSGYHEKIGLFDISGEKPLLVSTQSQAKVPTTIFASAVFASESSQVMYPGPNGKLYRATIKNAKFEKNEELASKPGEKDYPRAVTRDGSRLALWDGDHLKLWDLSAILSKPVKLPNPGSQAVRSDSVYRFSPDGHWLTARYTHTALFRIDGPEPKFVAWLDQTNFNSYGAAAFGSDSRKVIIGNDEGFVRFWDLGGPGPNEITPFDPVSGFISPSRYVRSNACGRDGRLLLPRYDAPVGKNRFQLWDFTSAKPQMLLGPTKFLDTDSYIHVAAKNRWLDLATITPQRSRLHSLSEERWQQIGEPFAEPNGSGNVTHDGSLLVTYAGSILETATQLEGWDLTTTPPARKWIRSLKDHPVGGQFDRRVWFSGNGRWFATQAQGPKDGHWKLLLWRHGPHPEIHVTISIKNQPYDYQAAFSPDGRYLCHFKDGVGGEYIAVEDLTGREPREVARLANGMQHVDVGKEWLAFHPDSRKLAVGSVGGVSVLEVPSGKVLWKWEAPGAVSWAEFAPDGRHLVMHNANKTIYVLRLVLPESPVNPGEKIEIVPKGTEKKPDEPKKVDVAWKPTPVGRSPFDKLDAEEVPKTERFDWQPKELVAVIGSHTRRHWGFITAVAVSPDGKLAASHAASRSDNLIIWDTGTQEARWTLNTWEFAHSGSLQFSQDSKRLYCLHGGNLRIFNLSGEKPAVSEFDLSEKEQRNPNWQFCFLCEKDRTLIVTGLNDDKIALFDISGDKPKWVSTQAHLRPDVNSVVFAREAQQIFYSDLGGKLRRAKIKNAKFEEDEELPINLGEKEYPRAVTPDGKQLALWNDDHLQLWDLSQNPPKPRQLKTGIFDVRSDAVYSFSPEGNWLTAKYGRTALFRTGGPTPKFSAWLDQTANFPSSNISMSAAGIAVVGCSEGFVRFWDLSAPVPTELAPFDPATGFMNPHRLVKSNILNGRAGKLLLSRYDPPPGKNSRFQLWQFAGNKPQPIPGRDEFLHADHQIHLAASDRWLELSRSLDFNSRLYHLLKGRWQPNGLPLDGPVGHGNVSPDGELLVVYAPPSEASPTHLQGWDLPTTPPTILWSRPLKEHPALGEHYRNAWFSADGRWFATQAQRAKDGPWKLLLWRNKGREPEVHATIPIKNIPDFYLAAFSPDGRYLCHLKDWSQVDPIAVEDLTGREPREAAKISNGMQNQTMHGGWLAFHPDSKKLVVGGMGGVSVLEVPSGKVLWKWEAPGAVDWAEFAADGRHLVIHNANKTIYVLRLAF